MYLVGVQGSLKHPIMNFEKKKKKKKKISAVHAPAIWGLTIVKFTQLCSKFLPTALLNFACDGQLPTGLVNCPNGISLSRANQSQAKFKSAVGRNLLQSWVNLTIIFMKNVIMILAPNHFIYGWSSFCLFCNICIFYPVFVLFLGHICRVFYQIYKCVKKN